MKDYLLRLYRAFIKKDETNTSKVFANILVFFAILLLLVNIFTGALIFARDSYFKSRAMHKIMPKAHHFVGSKKGVFYFNQNIYLAYSNNNKLIGSLITSSARGSNGTIKILVGISDDKVTGVHILSHNEPTGISSRIGSNKRLPGHYYSFLGQFTEKSIYDLYKINEDIIPISGAALNCQAIANGIKSAININKKLEEERWKRLL